MRNQMQTGKNSTRKLIEKAGGLLLLGLMFAAFSVFSQAQTPVSFSLNVKPAAKAGDKLNAQIQASIGAGWHLYSLSQGAGGPVPTTIKIADGVFKSAGSPSGSAPKREMDENFGIPTETYTGSASFNVPVSVDAAATGAQTLTISVRYQACNDKICLPPKILQVSAPIAITAKAISAAAQTFPSPSPTLSPTPTPSPNANSNIAATVAANSNSNTTAITDSETNANTTSSIASVENTNLPPQTLTDLTSPATLTNVNSAANTDDNQSIWAFIWLAVTVGALSLLTPCVFPMIPITVSYFTNHAAGNRAKAIKMATVYSLGIVATFTILGMLLAIFVGAAGINLFAANPYINLLIAGVFIFFAFNLFGAYEITVPSGVLTKLDNLTRSKEGEGSGVVGALLMGLTFTLTSFTCTSPFVGTILVSAANGNWQKPFLGMLAFSTVFALPFFVLALLPQYVSSLPRAGGWMNSVKVAMGFLEVAAAMKFISNVDLVWKWGIFTRDVVLAIWIALFAVLAVYLLGKFQLPHDSKPERIGAFRLMSAVGSLAVTFFLLTGLFGAKLGELESFLPPLADNAQAFFSNNKSGDKSGEIEWIKNDYEKAVAQAKAENKRIFINFTGYTCTNCRWMEANMFSRAEVKKELSKMVLLELYTDGEGEIYEKQQAFQEKTFQTVALPFYVVADTQGQSKANFPGLTRDSGEFVSFLRTGAL